jgi:hypothetical protein
VRHKSNRTGAIGGSLSALALALLLSSLASTAPAQASECPNEARRVEQRSTYLPDCRAYEMTSPPGLEPSQRAENFSDGYTASVSGERISFKTEQGQPSGSTGSSPGLYFLSTRGSEGWSTADLIPPQSTEIEHFCNPYIAGYSSDLSKEVLADGKGWDGYPHSTDDGGFTNCGHDEPLLVAGEAQGAQNVFLHKSGTPSEAGFYQLINVGQPEPGRNAYFQAGSADFSHIVFTDPIQLTADAPLPPERDVSQKGAGEDLYEYAGGVLRPVTILPDGSPTWGILVNSWESLQKRSSARFTHAVSNDGERVLFYGNGTSSEWAYAGGNLYMRENAMQPRTEECAAATKACTIQIDAPQTGSPSGPAERGHFQWASTDGSRVFFTDCAPLTEDATAVSSGGCGDFQSSGAPNGYQVPTGNDLYEYDLEKPVGQRLTDLTVDKNVTDPLGADVQGLTGVSEDGSYVYFVAHGVLTSVQNSSGAKAVAGQPNLYLRHAGATTYIATLDPTEGNGREGTTNGDWTDWSSYVSPEVEGQSHLTRMTSRISRDGSFIAFNSTKRLTSYDNTVAATGKPANEIYLYDASTNQLVCASCRPDGKSPAAENLYEQPVIYQPLKVSEGEENSVVPPSRQLSDQGQVFFDTSESLLPADENGTHDVYEYESGNLHLISSGTGSESRFREASADGENVFFTSDQVLVSSDTSGGLTLYDARVGGGFAPGPGVGPGGVVEAPACTSAEACKPPPGEPPAEPFAASSVFNGPGNLLSPPVNAPPVEKRVKQPRCRKGFERVKVHGRSACKRVAKHPKRKRPVAGAGKGGHR